MIFEYDFEADGAFIWLTTIDDAKLRFDREIWPVELGNAIGFFLDKDSKIVGIEFCPASKYLDEALLVDTYSNKPKKRGHSPPNLSGESELLKDDI